MEKPFVKSLTAVAVGAGAIAICLFGYHINNQRQHQQRINYAESAITNQKDTLTSLSKEVDKLYSTKEKIFLNPEITEETITSLSNKLSYVKLSADDYDIKESELPKEAVAIQDEKKAIVTQLDSAESKLKIQTAVNDLFTKNVSNWQQAVDSDRASHATRSVIRYDVEGWSSDCHRYLRSIFDGAQSNRADPE